MLSLCLALILFLWKWNIHWRNTYWLWCVTVLVVQSLQLYWSDLKLYWRELLEKDLLQFVAKWHWRFVWVTGTKWHQPATPYRIPDLWLIWSELLLLYWREVLLCWSGPPEVEVLFVVKWYWRCVWVTGTKWYRVEHLRISYCFMLIHTHTHNRFTAGLEYVRVHPGQQVPER